MQQFIVGALLISIIVCAGWLIIFYNKVVDKRALLDERRLRLNLQLEKRNKLLRELDSETNSVLDLSRLHYQLAELEENLSRKCGLYNDQILLYHKFLAAFPNNIAALILGVKRISDYEADAPEK